MFHFNPHDDMPEWVRRARMQNHPNWHELPQVTDTQKRCAICGSLLLGDEPEGTETCTPHRAFELLKLLVVTGEVTDWPQGCWQGHKRHIDGLNQAPRLTVYHIEIRALLSIYNNLHGTNYRLY